MYTWKIVNQVMFFTTIKTIFKNERKFFIIKEKEKNEREREERECAFDWEQEKWKREKNNITATLRSSRHVVERYLLKFWLD